MLNKVMVEHDDSRSAKRHSGWPDMPDMEAEEFQRWADLLKERAGLNLPVERKSFLLTNLLARMREVGCSTYREYDDYLRKGRRSIAEWAALIDRLTVHETRFFRDQEAMDLVADYCGRLVSQQESMHLWSAGCASGEEAYSLAMMVDQKISASGAHAFFGITATDISMPCLAKARAGDYSVRQLRRVPEMWRRHYFRELPNGQFRVVDWLKRRVAFLHLNIAETSHTPLGGMDVIYCQNVLIYFDQVQRHVVLDGMVKHLKPGGLLILGPGEVTAWNHPALLRMSGTRVLAFQHVNVNQ
jgi:type IV pilus assembly protein PilK